MLEERGVTGAEASKFPALRGLVRHHPSIGIGASALSATIQKQSGFARAGGWVSYQSANSMFYIASCFFVVVCVVILMPYNSNSFFYRVQEYNMLCVTFDG